MKLRWVWVRVAWKVRHAAYRVACLRSVLHLRRITHQGFIIVVLDRPRVEVELDELRFTSELPLWSACFAWLLY